MSLSCVAAVRPHDVGATSVFVASVSSSLVIVALIVAAVIAACVWMLRDGGAIRAAHTGSTHAKPGARARPRAKRRFSYGSYTDRGGRDTNEDAAEVRIAGTESGKSICAVVADGLGGHGGGDVASQTALNHILSGWKPEADADGLAELLEGASRAVIGTRFLAGACRTTAVVLSLARGHAWWANAGDSRLYHFVDASLSWRTADHSVSQMAVMLGHITQDEIRGHEDRARLFKVLGQDGEVNADVGELEVAPGENAYLLCTDGFWEYVLEREMEETLRKASSPRDWIGLMRQVHDRRAPEDCDNNSAVAIWLSAKVGHDA